jgi:transcriptional regulator with GAF, ATPase, and Fis domain
VKSEDPTQTSGVDGISPSAAGVRSHLVLAFEAARPLAASSRHSLDEVEVVNIGRASSRRWERDLQAGTRQLTLRVPDPRLSSNHARIAHVYGRWIVEDLESRNGTFVNGQRVPRAPLADGDLIEVGQTFLLFRDLATTPEQRPDVDAGELSPPVAEMATLSPALEKEFAGVAQVATTGVPILISGESGTGKEILAHAVHRLSGRGHEFVAVNCAALPEGLVEAELFGHRKGAFSGALEDRPGLVRSADGGTLFLDEIGDLRESSQGALLRVLQEREVLPVGGTKAIKVDLRVVAATHRDLPDLVAHNRFRSDLLARVSGYSVSLPALRERREDLGLLIAALLRRLAPASADKLSFTVAAARALFLYSWPHNVRELERCLETASALAGERPIDVEHLPGPVRTGESGPVSSPSLTPVPRRPAELADDDAALGPDRGPTCRELEALMHEHQGNLSAVARALGKDRVQIRRWLKRCYLDPRSFRPGK